MRAILLRKILKYCVINTDSTDRIARGHKNFLKIKLISRGGRTYIYIYIYIYMCMYVYTSTIDEKLMQKFQITTRFRYRNAQLIVKHTRIN